MSELIEYTPKQNFLDEVDSMEETVQYLYEEADYDKVLRAFGNSWENVGRNLGKITEIAKQNKKEKELQSIMQKYNGAFEYWNKTNESVQNKSKQGEEILQSDLPEAELEESIRQYKKLCEELRNSADLITEKAPEVKAPTTDKVKEVRKGILGKLGSILGW
jgi:DNA-binding transcriptional MerR regulator